ncbi:hypothetical protein [Nocardia ninae]|uniref:hypothetical protein n=1 Tax=Nocardia ninae TaxID=356145 RepID=UPI0011BE1EA6|nr:hypothetical protein [Nocardia ninae]
MLETLTQGNADVVEDGGAGPSSGRAQGGGCAARRVRAWLIWSTAHLVADRGSIVIRRDQGVIGL